MYKYLCSSVMVASLAGTAFADGPGEAGFVGISSGYNQHSVQDFQNGPGFVRADITAKQFAGKYTYKDNDPAGSSKTNYKFNFAHLDVGAAVNASLVFAGLKYGRTWREATGNGFSIVEYRDRAKLGAGVSLGLISLGAGIIHTHIDSDTYTDKGRDSIDLYQPEISTRISLGVLALDAAYTFKASKKEKYEDGTTAVTDTNQLPGKALLKATAGVSDLISVSGGVEFLDYNRKHDEDDDYYSTKPGSMDFTNLFVDAAFNVSPMFSQNVGIDKRSAYDSDIVLAYTRLNSASKLKFPGGDVALLLSYDLATEESKDKFDTYTNSTTVDSPGMSYGLQLGLTL